MERGSSDWTGAPWRTIGRRYAEVPNDEAAEPLSQYCSLRCDQTLSTTIFRLAGEFDLASEERFQEELGRRLDNDVDTFLLDRGASRSSTPPACACSFSSMQSLGTMASTSPFCAATVKFGRCYGRPASMGCCRWSIPMGRSRLRIRRSSSSSMPGLRDTWNGVRANRRHAHPPQVSTGPSGVPTVHSTERSLGCPAPVQM